MKQLRILGFTLIELMIVVVILSVLAAIAYPSYSRYSIRSKRSDAQIALTQIAALQEKYYADCSYYAQSIAGARSCGTGVGDGTLGFTATGTSLGGYYNLAIAAGNLGAGCVTFTCGFTITATPIPNTTQAGDGNIRIDSLGARQWDKNNDLSYGFRWTDK